LNADFFLSDIPQNKLLQNIYVFFKGKSMKV